MYRNEENVSSKQTLLAWAGEAGGAPGAVRARGSSRHEVAQTLRKTIRPVCRCHTVFTETGGGVNHRRTPTPECRLDVDEAVVIP